MSDRTALLVIDMQIGLVEGAFRADAVLDRIVDLIHRARLARVPVIHVQHHHATYAPLKAGAATRGVDAELGLHPGHDHVGHVEAS